MEAGLVYFIENRCAFYFLIDLVVPGVSRCVKCRAICEDDGVIQWLSDMVVWIFRFWDAVFQIFRDIFLFEQGCGSVLVSLDWNHLNSHESLGDP